jgi:hypothetical protein
MISSVKRSSFFDQRIKDKEKVQDYHLGPMLKTFLWMYLMNDLNKLQCFPLAGLSGLI